MSGAVLPTVIVMTMIVMNVIVLTTVLSAARGHADTCCTEPSLVASDDGRCFGVCFCVHFLIPFCLIVFVALSHSFLSRCFCLRFLRMMEHQMKMRDTEKWMEQRDMPRDIQK